MKPFEIIVGCAYSGKSPNSVPRHVLRVSSGDLRYARVTYMRQDRDFETFCYMSSFLQWAKEKIVSQPKT